jgi:glycosyltransferase involved in cell wall biosynthesis
MDIYKSMNQDFATQNNPNMIVDGIIYSFQKHGGISRIFTEVLPRLCNLDASLKISLTYTEPKSTHLPKHERISYKSIPDMEKYFRPYRVWHPLYPQLRQMAIDWNFLGNSRKKIWLSTYYTTPLSWSGVQVAFVYDFIHEAYRHTYWQDDPTIADLTIKNKAKSIKNADLIICISESTRQDLLRLYQVPLEKTAVVHLAHHPIFSVAIKSKDKREKEFILFIGNRSRYKGFDTLLEAFASWKQQDMDLVCAGGGEWSEMETQKISKYGLLKRLTLFPQTSDEHLAELYNQASAFVYPSHYEGFGIPLLEAMACGCPIVASRIPSFVEVARDVPFYFTPGKSEELIVGLEKSMNKDENLWRRQAGLSLSHKYTWEKTAGDFLQALQPLR